MERRQLEMTLGGPGFRAGRRRAGRARWWFAQMRLIVDQTTEWQPEPGDRPEWASLERREEQGCN
jgi:hypothetical protein